MLERLHAPARELDQVLLQRAHAERVLDLVVGELAVRTVGVDEELAVAPRERRRDARVGEFRRWQKLPSTDFCGRRPASRGRGPSLSTPHAAARGSSRIAPTQRKSRRPAPGLPLRGRLALRQRGKSRRERNDRSHAGEPACERRQSGIRRARMRKRISTSSRTCSAPARTEYGAIPKLVCATVTLPDTLTPSAAEARPVPECALRVYDAFDRERCIQP